MIYYMPISWELNLSSLSATHLADRCLVTAWHIHHPFALAISEVFVRVAALLMLIGVGSCNGGCCGGAGAGRGDHGEGSGCDIGRSASHVLLLLVL